MFNENNNDKSQYEYHYVYRPTSSDPWENESAAPAPKRKRGRRALKIVAGVLCGVLALGGAFGAGWLVNSDYFKSDAEAFKAEIRNELRREREQAPDITT